MTQIPTPLADSVAAQYSELLRHAVRPAPDGSNLSFKSKTIKGRTYWYLYVSLGRRRTEHYLGAETPELLETLDKERGLWASAADDRRVRSRLVSMLLAGGATETRGDEGKVLALLERGGVFLSGGVLIGTIAFRAFANQLGITWPGETQTRDIDIASDLKVSVAVPAVDKDAELEVLLAESGMGFIPVPSLDRKSSATEFSLRGRELSVELLTPMLGKPDGKPVFLHSLGGWAEPVRFIDYLLDDVQIAVLLYSHGVLVNVPSPARYALHKLVVSQRRPAAFSEKAGRDLAQAEMLLRILHAERPGDLILAGEAARQMGDKFMKLLERGFGLIEQDLAAECKSLLAT